MNRKVTGILSYCGLIGWLVAFLGGDRTARFHLNQGFVYVVLSFAVNAVEIALSPFRFWFGWLIWPLFVALSLVNVGITVLRVLGIVSAARDREDPLPLGNLFAILR